MLRGCSWLYTQEFNLISVWKTIWKARDHIQTGYMQVSVLPAILSLWHPVLIIWLASFIKLTWMWAISIRKIEQVFVLCAVFMFFPGLVVFLCFLPVALRWLLGLLVWLNYHSLNFFCVLNFGGIFRKLLFLWPENCHRNLILGYMTMVKLVPLYLYKMYNIYIM